MKQSRKPYVFLLVLIVSTSIVTTGLFFGFRREICTTSPNSNVPTPWQKIGNDIDGEAAGDYPGWSVALSSDGNTVAIGGADGNGEGSGHVRIFQWTAKSTWTQVGADIDGEAAYDVSGFSLSLSSDGKTVAIGAPRNDGNGSWSGHVRIFQWTESSSTWTQVGADIDGEAAYDVSGHSVSLSSDGNTVAIGAVDNDGNGSRSGHVRIFQWTESTSTWTQMGADIDGEAADDESAGPCHCHRMAKPWPSEQNGIMEMVKAVVMFASSNGQSPLPLGRKRGQILTGRENGIALAIPYHCHRMAIPWPLVQ
jgi:hypothetical protein